MPRRTGTAPSPERDGLTRGDRRLLGAAAVLTAASGLTRYLPAGVVLPFVVSALGLAALAAVVGRTVDQLSHRLSAGATGLIQSSLGNLPELFFGIFALRSGLVQVVLTALAGSIVANVLLVLGISFVVGGLRHGTQRFVAENARTVALLLLLAVAVLVVPTVAAHVQAPAAAHEGALSDVAAVVLLAVFALSIPASLTSAVPASGAPDSGRAWPMPFVIVMLALSAAGAAFVSDWFVADLRPALNALHISQAFAGFVIVAIAGNAVENAVGVQLAARNRPDYALNIILQSPVQIALALIPVLVLISPAVGGVTLTLAMPVMLVTVLAVTAVIAVVVVFDGESTWLEGVTLIGLYAVVATAFWWG